MVHLQEVVFLRNRAIPFGGPGQASIRLFVHIDKLKIKRYFFPGAAFIAVRFDIHPEEALLGLFFRQDFSALVIVQSGIRLE